MSVGKFNDIFVAGAGCIGQVLAISLLKSNPFNRVFLITKPAYIKEIQNEGITTKGIVEGLFTPNANFLVTDKVDDNFFAKNNITKNPIIFSTTKANDVVSSLLPFQNLANIAEPSIVCLQNGLGTEREVLKCLPGNKGLVLKGSVLGAVQKKNTALFAYRGKLLIEDCNKNTSSNLLEIFSGQKYGIFDLEMSKNIYRDIYPKIAVNCVCNPLTIIFNEPIGFLINHCKPLIKSICQEVYAVALSQNIALPSAQYLTNFVINTLSNPSEHYFYSSMYDDHVAGKKTEIDYINGSIARIARENGVNTPINELLTKSIKEITEMRAKVNSSEEFYQIHDLYLKSLVKKLRELQSY